MDRTAAASNRAARSTTRRNDRMKSSIRASLFVVRRTVALSRCCIQWYDFIDMLNRMQNKVEHRSELFRTDLNLLVLFETVMRERHVGRATERMSLSPSAVSHGLARLRALLSDP